MLAELFQGACLLISPTDVQEGIVVVERRFATLAQSDPVDPTLLRVQSYHPEIVLDRNDGEFDIANDGTLLKADPGDADQLMGCKGTGMDIEVMFCLQKSMSRYL